MRCSHKYFYGATFALALVVAPHVSAADNGVALLSAELTEAEATVSNAFIDRSLESVLSHLNFSQVGCDSCCDDACCGGGVGCDGCFTGSCTGGAGGGGLDVGGWLATGFYDNSHGLSGPTANSPLGFNNIGDEFQLHQAWLYMGKEADNGGSGIAFGFRADFMFGTDGPNTSAFGDGSWDASWATSGNGQYAFAFPQLYAEVAVGNTSIKIGHFYTIIGYEVVQAPGNFFYSHAYTMVYNEPFTHTGILATTPIGDNLTAYYGLTMGWDTGFDNRNDGSTFLGGLGTQVTDNISATWAMTVGDPGDSFTTTSDVYMQSVVVDVALTDDVQYIFHTDYQTRTPDANVAPSTFKNYGINQYLILALTDKLKAGMRYEWYRDGAAGVDPTGGLNHFHAISFGANLFTGDNIVIKPEMRYDWVDRDDASGAGGPFAGGSKRSQFTWGAQGIMTF